MTATKKILISTGEVSGDLISSYLITALREKDPSLEILAVGGTQVEKAGARLIFNSYCIGAMGLVEAIPMFTTVLKLRRAVAQVVREEKIDLVVLVDCNGFNSGLAAKLKKKGVPTVCFIPPQDWVFGKVNRLMRTFIRCCHKIISIFPKEHEFYSSLGARSVWLGHPLVDIVSHVPTREQARHTLGYPLDAKVITLLPISRQQEVQYILPGVLATVALIQKQCPDAYFCLPVVRLDLMQKIEAVLLQSGVQRVSIVQKSSHIAIAAADVVLSKSGTVNLETALIGIPQVVFYRLNSVTFWIGKNILRMPKPHFISPVNLIAMQAVVPEFLQDQATPQVLAKAVLTILDEPRKAQQRFSQGYALVRQQLGQPGVMKRVADLVLTLLASTSPIDGKEGLL